MPNKDITYIPGYEHKKFEELYDHHSPFEEETNQRLEKLGFYAEAAPYHKVYQITVQTALHKNFDITASYIRSRADRVIVHKQTSFTCQLEIKTPRYEHEKFTMYAEAMPLFLHIYNSKIGIKTLYTYHDPFNNLSVVFWVTEDIIRYIQEIKIPHKHGINPKYYEHKFRQILGSKVPPITIIEKSVKRGSGDPYAVIDLAALIPRFNLDLGLILRKAIDEYLIDYTPSEPIHCPSCQKTLDLSRIALAQDKWKLLEQTIVHCDHCGNRFCSTECLNSHRPPQDKKVTRSKELFDLFHGEANK